MVRFSCFYPQIPSHKPKKAAQPSFEAKLKMLKCGSESHASANVIDPMSLNKAPLIQKADDGERNETEHIVLASRVWRSGEFNSEFRAENEKDIHKMGNLRKTRSLGCKLDDLHRRILDENNTGDCDQSHDCNEGPELSPPLDPRSSGSNMSIREQEVVQSESPHQSFDQVNHESIVTISDPHSLEKQGHEDSDAFLYAMSAGDFGEHINRSPVLISRSCSVPNFGSSSTTSGERSSCRSSPPRNKFEDLNALRCKGKEILFSDDHTQLPGNTINDNLNKSMEKGEMAVHDGYDFYKYAVPVSEEVDFVKNHPGESSSHQGDQFPSKDFKKKRIEEWVNDLQHCSPLEQTDEVFDSGEEVKKSSPVLDGLDLTKSGAKINSGMEAAKRYISSLNAAATSVQLVNHGLVVIPFLRSFFSLKVLNLSGNSIARITAGALPRGLHMLNLSRNKISTIEGLRELTRLRVLDLSCNKISRIGHGLAHCSSLKELYLAGNKISEVEGLHRLLKLTVLDLRFNKIATSKCLGQLAANYNSLQAINLEGNPAQKNVGDEQLKKYLQGLLPHLAYYNRQSIKTSTLKDSAERAVRLGSAHQFDRGLRSDHKSGRWASHGAVSLRQSAHKGQGSELGKRSKGRHGHLPPSATRVSNHPNHRHHQLEIGNKVLGLRSELSIPKSRSVGTLAAL